MIGLTTGLMGTVINDIGRQVRAGRNFTELGLFEDLVEGYACKIFRVDPRWHSEYFGFAMWHRSHLGKRGTLEALQCVWPDKSGRFPDEQGCEPEIVKRQPLLKHFMAHP